MSAADRVERWLKTLDNTIERYGLTKWSRMTTQERWDYQPALNRGHASSQERVARVADRLGLEGVAARARQEAEDRRWMADRAEECPNNPRNGGDGFDRGDGTWVDRRGPDWEYVEGWRARQRTESSERFLESEVDSLTRDAKGDERERDR